MFESMNAYIDEIICVKESYDLMSLNGGNS